MSNKSVLQLADEWIVGFLDRQQGQTFTVGEVCRIAFQAGYRTRVLEKFEETAEAYQRGKWVEDAVAVVDNTATERISKLSKIFPKAPSNSPKNSDSSDDSDAPDLQEQIEALQQYMAVAQRKIMALQANVEFLLYHNKDKMGESEAIRRMQQTMQGFGRNNE